MRIASSAPTRIDLAGGTLDIWPLYLFHERAQTLNVAIRLPARAEIEPEPSGRIVIMSEDSGETVAASDCEALDPGGPLPLLSRLVRHFGANGLRLTTRAESPIGAGIAGSSAMNVAVCGALAAWTGTPLREDVLLATVQNIEAQVIRVPTGAQDYRPAYFGGVSAVELNVDQVRRVALDVDPREIQARIVLAYTGASRNSGINNWDVTRRHLDGDREIFDRFERIRDIAVAMRAALERGDWVDVARQISAEWDNRQALAPGVTTPGLDQLIARARAAGAAGAKVCGAGGGGCLFCIGEPDTTPAIRQALADGGARVLDFHVDLEGLRVRVDP